MTAAPEVPGLTVQRHRYGRGWGIIHQQSGLPVAAYLQLRLQRHANAAAADLAATGADFTLPAAQLTKSPQWPAVAAVISRWLLREQGCCEGDEHYSASTYMLEGLCTGPLRLPRRS